MTPGPHATGVGGGGCGAGRPREPSGTAKIDDDSVGVDDDPPELTEQGGHPRFGRIDVVAVLATAHEVVGVELGWPVVLHRAKHLFERGGGPVDVVDEPGRDRTVGCGCGDLEDPEQRISAALGRRAVQIRAGHRVAQPGFCFGPIGLKFGFDEHVEDLAHLNALQRREEAGEVPRRVPWVRPQRGVAVLVVAFVGRFGTVLVDQPFPPPRFHFELFRRHVVRVGQEFVLAGLHGRGDPLVGVDPTEEVHLVGADLAVRPCIGQHGEIAARLRGLLPG